MFLISILTGTRMLWQYKNANWLVNMQQVSLAVCDLYDWMTFLTHCTQSPPLATIWIYTIVHQDLELAITSLIIVGLFVWYKGMSLF